MADILDGITIGSFGGAIAGVTVWAVQSLRSWHENRRDRKTVYTWLKMYTSSMDGKQFRSTRAVASHTNLTMDRVRYICSIDERIFLSTGQKEDMWALHAHAVRGDADYIRGPVHLEL